ncbi:cobinamide phosphate guanylyltransferase [Arcobacter sp. CECT 8983]|uniref:bifunctional adenosylcobinamide kinase/adenosylcobinamide-phosphate guanylyltransferase n=1 Tax=Arcobacter sp. CECT 8983 TaxID=2044508 RepID=UPI00100B34FC|nr:bifunctional adenosylcobinamide kinase/adenosylcobinamide-phosphate guanylyltransferase [Arcobacter sp. CECT 8983]RXJ89175.1 cobinamide phosphate guanylyltransferase [Arcobacter sp. CECT 8983]
MKILYFGGQKSGKSNLAEQKALNISLKKSYYLATYDNSFNDKEMHKRIDKHKLQRKDEFTTIEEPKDLLKVLSKSNNEDTFLIDCMSMWLFNNIDETEEYLIKQLEEISKLDANIVFVLNDVNSGVIPYEKESRKFVDMTGIVGQKLASICAEVYEVKLGLANKLK